MFFLLVGVLMAEIIMKKLKKDEVVWVGVSASIWVMKTWRANVFSSVISTIQRQQK